MTNSLMWTLAHGIAGEAVASPDAPIPGPAPRLSNHALGRNKLRRKNLRRIARRLRPTQGGSDTRTRPTWSAARYRRRCVGQQQHHQGRLAHPCPRSGPQPAGDRLESAPAAVPTTRAGPRRARVQGGVLGGMDPDNQPTLAGEILDPASGRWTRGPGLPPGRHQTYELDDLL
jgi:hypothetical protein